MGILPLDVFKLLATHLRLKDIDKLAVTAKYFNVHKQEALDAYFLDRRNNAGYLGRLPHDIFNFIDLTPDIFYINPEFGDFC